MFFVSTVSFYDEVSRKRINVTGPFLFTDCWWQIEATIHPGTRKVKDIPKYKIKEQWNLEMISKYLKKTGIERPDDVETLKNVIKMMYQKGTDNRNLSLTVEEILELKNLKERASERQIPIFEKERAALSLMENHANSSGDLPTYYSFGSDKITPRTSTILLLLEMQET